MANLRFYCVGGSWEWTRDCCRLLTESQSYCNNHRLHNIHLTVQHLKGTKHENFVSEFFTSPKNTWDGDQELKKIDFLKFGLWHFSVCSGYANFDKNETIKNDKLVRKSFGPIQGPRGLQSKVYWYFWPISRKHPLKTKNYIHITYLQRHVLIMNWKDNLLK